MENGAVREAAQKDWVITMERFDLVIIGGGPAGYEAAAAAGAGGLRTALVEKDALGGTCLNRGCIPTKTMLHSAEAFRQLQEERLPGISVREISVDMGQLARRRTEVIEKLQAGIAMLMKKQKVTVLEGVGTVLDAHRVQVTGPEMVLEAETILVAAGSRPALPPVPGMELPGVLTSDELLKSDRLYESLTIVGGGVIGMEFASVYSALGCRVTVIEFLDRILANMDKEISQNLKMILKKRGVEIHTGAAVKELQQRDGRLVCRYEEKGAMQEEASEAVLIATGRRACTEGLFDKDCTPAMERGRIVTDGYGRTSIPEIYAAGDITCGIQLAHAAAAEAKNAVAHILQRRQCASCGPENAVGTPYDLAAVPACVYTDPEIGCVGLTQEEAKAAGKNVIVKKYPMSANGKSILTDQERGFIKVVADAQTHRLLGAQLMCGRATDLIGELCAAIAGGLTLEQLAAAVHPHPTFCEGIGEAVRL